MTKFTIRYPNRNAVEIAYILDVILGQFLSIEYLSEASNIDYIEISAEGRKAILRTHFFSQYIGGVPSESPLPAQPIEYWDARQLLPSPRLVDVRVPVIFGSANIEFTENTVEISIDILGTAFFLLTCCEEFTTPVRDSHDRLPASASFAVKEGILERPIVDEYVEILWSCLKHLWPGLKRRQHEFSVVLSADVDRPYHPASKAIRWLVRQVAVDVAIRRDATRALKNILNYLGSLRETYDYRFDPYFPSFDFMMTRAEQAHTAITFNFLAGVTDPDHDGCYTLAELAIQDLLRQISQRGHCIGLHPSYGTYRSPELIKREFANLFHHMKKNEIKQKEVGGRQHYLRWTASVTPFAYEEAGLAYDSTISFPDRPGFRSGTCRTYPMFDLVRRRPLKLLEIPLIVMEETVLSPVYLGIQNEADAFDRMNSLKQKCKLFDGNFALLWHNSSLQTPRDREIFSQLI